MSLVTMKRIRCGCTDEQKASPDWHAALVPAQPCPNPREVEDLGDGGAVVASKLTVDQETIRKEH